MVSERMGTACKQKPRHDWRGLERVKLTDKPGSVVDSHSSRPAIAHWLKQPTRVQYGPYLMNPYLALLRVEFTVPRTVARRAVRSYRTLSPLPDPTYAGHRRFALCCTGRGLAPPRRYLAPCPVEPGLSSLLFVYPKAQQQDGDCPANPARIIGMIAPCGKLSLRILLFQPPGIQRILLHTIDFCGQRSGFFQR